MAYNRPKHTNRINAQEAGDALTQNDGLTSGIDDRTQPITLGTSKGFARINVVTNNTPSSFDSAQDAWHAETFKSFAVPVIINRDSSYSLNNLMRNFRNDRYINVTSDSGARYKDTMWTYGGGVRIYSDGTTPDINFVDSNYFRGGADHSTLMIQGGETQDNIATNLASAPDSDFLNYQEDSFYSAPRAVINNEYSLHTSMMGLAEVGFYNDYSNRKVTITALPGVPFEYDSSEVLYTQAAYDSAAGSGGGGASQDDLDSANALIVILRDDVDSAETLITTLRDDLDSAEAAAAANVADPEAWS